MKVGLTKKTIQLKQKFDISFLKLNCNNFIVVSTNLDNKKYLYVPGFVNITKTDRCLLIQSYLDASTSLYFTQFLLRLNQWIKKIYKPATKKLLLRGLGFKITNTCDNKSLDFKLGYSHIIRVDVPSNEISIKIEKNSLLVQGFDPIQVGNFTSKVQRLKFPDNYKGKGFWLKNDSIVLKEVKKT